jgi:pimeloyl-ACP methyl ester carboxylesterase
MSAGRVAVAALLGLAILTAAGCGGGSATKKPRAPAIAEEGPFGVGADKFWLYRPTNGSPRAVVVFLHGLGRESLTPRLHRPWLRHLAAQGNAVVYPVYELGPGSFGALRHLVTTVSDARHRLKTPFVPTIVIGYSRGGRLAVEYAAIAPGVNQTPAAVMSVFPGLLNPAAEEQVDLASVDPRTIIWFLVGDRDRSVGREGARDLLARLQRGGFPPEQVRAIVVVSHDDFEANHGAPLDTSPAARRAFWDRADRLIEQAVEANP